MSEEQTDESADSEPVDVGGADSPDAADDDKSPIIALLLSWVFPGLGHFYADGIEARGLIFAVVGLISYMLIFVGIGLFTSPVVVLAACIDAYMRADD